MRRFRARTIHTCEMRAQLAAYFAGELREFTVPLDDQRHSVSRESLGGAPDHSLW